MEVLKKGKTSKHRIWGPNIMKNIKTEPFKAKREGKITNLGRWRPKYEKMSTKGRWRQIIRENGELGKMGH